MSRKQAYVYFYASYYDKFNRKRDLDFFVENQDTGQGKSFCNSVKHIFISFMLNKNLYTFLRFFEDIKL